MRTESRSCQGLTVHVAGKCYPCHSWGHLLCNRLVQGWGAPLPKRGCRLVILSVAFTGEHRPHFKAHRKGGIFVWMRDESYDFYEELRSFRSLPPNTWEISSRSELKSCILTFIEVPVAASNQKKALGLSLVAHSKRVVYHRLESDLSL